MSRIQTELRNANATIYAISNENAADQKRMKEGEKMGDGVVFLSDPKATAANLYAGHYAENATLKPATFVVGPGGKIVYAYVGEDYKARASAQNVLLAVKKFFKKAGK